MTEFSKKAAAKSGRRSECKACVKSDRQKAARDPRHVARSLLGSARRRSKRRGHPPPTISFERILACLEVSGCEISDEAFHLAPGPRSTHTPTLHRKDLTKPYTEENTLVVIWHVNAALSQYSYEDFIWLSKKVLEKNGYSVRKKPQKKSARRAADNRCADTLDMFSRDELSAVAPA